MVDKDATENSNVAIEAPLSKFDLDDKNTEKGGDGARQGLGNRQIKRRNIDHRNAKEFKVLYTGYCFLSFCCNFIYIVYRIYHANECPNNMQFPYCRQLEVVRSSRNLWNLFSFAWLKHVNCGDSRQNVPLLSRLKSVVLQFLSGCTWQTLSS